MGVSSADRVSFSTLPHASRNTFLCTTIADSQSDEEKQLSLDTVAELIDTTFVNACMQLSKGYVDVLKLFIVSIKSGYELGILPLELIQRVDAVERKAAGRELMVEEIRLRNTWMQVVYLVLSKAGYSSPNVGVTDSIDNTIVAAYSDRIAMLVKRRESGEDFRADDLIDADADVADPAAGVIMAQSLRVVWLTLVVLEEEERCNSEFARQDAPMRPQIPGAFKE